MHIVWTAFLHGQQVGLHGMVTMPNTKGFFLFLTQSTNDMKVFKKKMGGGEPKAFRFLFIVYFKQSLLHRRNHHTGNTHWKYIGDTVISNKTASKNTLREFQIK